jgi:hypothetical protein
MAKRNYTREILTQVRAGRVPVSSVGPEYVVQYAPRSKYDPQPWTNGAYRYSGREVHTVIQTCGQTVAFGSGRCGRPKRHNGMCHD